MQDSFIQKISPTIRILILLIISLILFIAKSIYLILFITTFTLILYLVTGKSVNEYVYVLKKTLFLLLIFLFIYIIMFNECEILDIIKFIYKLINLDVIFSVFIFNSSFRVIHQGLYGILMPFKKFKIDVEKISYDLTLTLYFIKTIFFSSYSIKDISNFYGAKSIGIKNMIFSKITISVVKFNRFQELLKIEFYSLNYKGSDLKSKIVLVMFVILLVGCMFKEVIL